MAGAGAKPEKIGELSRLATLAAERILEAQITDRPLTRELFTALVHAAQLLEDHNVPWPPLVEQVLYEAGRRFSEADAAGEATDPKPEGVGLTTGFMRFLGNLRRP
ncbi:hypothetical protein [Methylobacterium sp. R2-1]|uniref:hypothetical protein n=1 Tax=Methylobacterium sp. R2-1 TaxID=2587064 RepID=UPI001620610A|nr:hypothetical protein [Methylobacterium sp. R2-1]MBB2964624.1 hypothetical protein [Methylobacterium sp. R2-1]